MKNRVLVISGPSGAGKHELRRALCKHPMFAPVISTTTRTPRKGEQDGVDYHFVAHNEMRKLTDGQDLMLGMTTHGAGVYGVNRLDFGSAFNHDKIGVVIATPDGQAAIEHDLAGHDIPVLSVFLDCALLLRAERMLARFVSELYDLRGTHRGEALRANFARRLAVSGEEEAAWKAKSAERFDCYIKQITPDCEKAVVDALVGNVLTEFLQIETVHPLMQREHAGPKTLVG